MGRPECRLGESERMVGASWKSSKEVVTASQGWGQEKELVWEAVCSEERWSDIFVFWWISIYVKIYEIFGLQKYFPKCLLIAQILSCKIIDLAPTYFHDAQCLIFDHLTCFFFLFEWCYLYRKMLNIKKGHSSCTKKWKNNYLNIWLLPLVIYFK